MKILHVTQNYAPSVGGQQHTIKRISEYLHEVYKDDVTVFTTNSYFGPHRFAFNKIDKEKEVINGVKVERFGYIKTHKTAVKFLGKIYKKLFKKALPEFFMHIQYGPVSPLMRRAIKDAEVDIICTSSVHFLFSDYAIWRKNLSNSKAVVIYGSLHLHNSHFPEQYKKRIAAADCYIANTNYEKQYLVDRGIAEEKIKTIGTATDILERADFTMPVDVLKNNYSIDAGKVIITFIGRQETSKGIPVLLDAFLQVNKRFNNIQLLIAGAKGTYTNELLAIIAQNKNISLLSNISDTQKAEVLRITDFLVLPSIEESFGVVFIEAWSFEKPVIGADIGAVASLIKNGGDGLLFEPGNAKSLAEKMELLIKDDLLREKLGKAGFEKFDQNYRWPVVASKYRDIYSQAIEKHNKIKPAHEI